MPLWLSAIISLFKAWWEVRADQHDKEQQEVGETKQSNADLVATNAALQAELQTAADVTLEIPAQELQALREGKE